MKPWEVGLSLHSVPNTIKWKVTGQVYFVRLLSENNRQKHTKASNALA